MNRLRRLRLVLLAASHMTLLSTDATTYHIDRENGDDANPGTEPDRAWQSLHPVNQTVFKPGDNILFKCGTRYNGQLEPKGSGSESNGIVTPIRIGTYGKGSRPRIDGDGKTQNTVLLRNVEFWEVADLEITNRGERREPWRTGVHVSSDGFGPMRHILLTNLYVHDVNGDLRKSHEGCGIYFESRGRNESRFEGLRIENCHLVRTDRNGICQRARNRGRSTGVIIRGNLLEDIGGDGIKIWGSNGALVEHNVIRGGRMRCEDYAAGIWPFSSDDTLIQFNEVSGMKGTKDGQGFDSDYNCRRSVFQYNYSHDNEGGFFLICSPGNAYNEDTIIRYNISQNDGADSSRVFHFGGGASNTLVYNNTIHVGPRKKLSLVLFTEWDGGRAESTQFFNNLFLVEGEVWYETGKDRNTIFEHNVFWGTHRNAPTDAYASTNLPPLVDAGTGAAGMDSLKGYRPKPGSDFPRGRMVQQNGGRDFFGTPVPTDKPPAMGAVEPSN